MWDVSVKESNGCNASTVLNGAKFRDTQLSHQGGHALETCGILRGKEILQSLLKHEYTSTKKENNIYKYLN